MFYHPTPSGLSDQFLGLGKQTETLAEITSLPMHMDSRFQKISKCKTVMAQGGTASRYAPPNNTKRFAPFLCVLNGTC